MRSLFFAFLVVFTHFVFASERLVKINYDPALKQRLLAEEKSKCDKAFPALQESIAAEINGETYSYNDKAVKDSDQIRGCLEAEYLEAQQLHLSIHKDADAHFRAVRNWYEVINSQTPLHYGRQFQIDARADK